jgi:glycolate oxidase FAD binding subunit
MNMAETFRPANEAELRALIADAAANARCLRLRGGGSKDSVGASSDAAIVDMTGFAGVVDYDPPELVLTVRPGTPLAEIQTLLAANDQMLAFAPYDPAPLFGDGEGRATIGGTVAAGLSGSQRLTQGAARDHLLGFAAVSGRGESFVGGAKVVKNVTGYDLPKVIAGSWGRLAAMTELTLKVLPRPAASATLIAEGLSPRQGWQAMAHCLQSHAEVAAAGHVPAGAVGARSITALRVQGFAPSVEARCQIIEAIAHDDWRFARIDEDGAGAVWDALRTLSPLAGERTLWRVSLPARHAPDFLAELRATDGDWLMDWAGGLVWYAGAADAAAVRAAALRLGGHAMLMRGTEALRASVPAFHPLDAGVAALEERVRRAFDPAGIFETGRF